MPSKSITVNALLKIGQNEHILDLQKNGSIFCNTIKTFREIETKDTSRRDAREGAYKTEYLNAESMKIYSDGKQLPVKFTSARLNLFDRTKENHKLYCLFGFKQKHAHGEPFIREDVCNFGDTGLIIMDSFEFVNRIQSKLKKLGIKYDFDWVRYYKEEKVNKGLSVFHKPDDFEYQSEFRFYIKHEDPEPLKFSIGSIEDITKIIDSSKLTKLRLKRLEEVSES